MGSWWLIALSIITSVAGQTVIKLGVLEPHAATASGGIVTMIALILRSPLVLLGLALYGVGALAWIAVLSRFNLSLAYPFLALNFVLIALVSQLLLGEAIPMLRWVGIGVICVGVILVGRSSL
ncbi:MAG: hypothetical protein R3C14_40625 [Caldilineaceae bacterium]